MFQSLGYEVARSFLVEANLSIACECVSFRLAFVRQRALGDTFFFPFRLSPAFRLTVINRVHYGVCNT